MYVLYGKVGHTTNVLYGKVGHTTNVLYGKVGQTTNVQYYTVRWAIRLMYYGKVGHTTNVQYYSKVGLTTNVQYYGRVGHSTDVGENKFRSVALRVRRKRGVISSACFNPIQYNFQHLVLGLPPFSACCNFFLIRNHL